MGGVNLEAAHEGGGCPQERVPGLQSASARQLVSYEPSEKTGDVGLGRYLHTQQPIGRVLAVASISQCFGRTVMSMELQADVVAPAGTWSLDPVHSRVDFEVRYLAGTFKGEFHEIGAELTVEPERASLEGTAKVASVDVKDENLSAHLQSPDFFDAERHPDLRFAAQDIRLDGDGDGAASVDGELTIKGVTKPVSVSGTVSAPIVDPYGNERI